VWGINPGGNHGFAVSDLDEKQIFAGNARYIPHVIFNVEPMLDIDEVISTLTQMQKQPQTQKAGPRALPSRFKSPRLLEPRCPASGFRGNPRATRVRQGPAAMATGTRSA